MQLFVTHMLWTASNEMQWAAQGELLEWACKTFIHVMFHYRNSVFSFGIDTAPCLHGNTPNNTRAKMLTFESFSGSDSLWLSLLDQQFYLPPTGKDLWCYGQQTSSHIQLQRGPETGRLLLWSLWPFNIPSYANCSRGWGRHSLIYRYYISLSYRNI